MSLLKPRVLPDGTKCYTGPKCKKHGVRALRNAQKAQIQESKNQLNELFDNVDSRSKKPFQLKPEVLTENSSKMDNFFSSPVSTESVFPPKPEWWNKHIQQNFDNTTEIFQRFGLQKSFVPTFHEQAMQYGYIGVETGDKDTQLIVGTDGTYYKSGEKYYCRAWMYKNGEPVAMVRFATYDKDYVPEPNQYQYVESVVCDIEVNPKYRGNMYGIELITQVEKNILAGRSLHSGGSYTPEGYRTFGNVLPYTHEAKMTYKKDFAAGNIPKPSFQSMNFVHDWDQLQLM